MKLQNFIKLLNYNISAGLCSRLLIVCWASIFTNLIFTRSLQAVSFRSPMLIAGKNMARMTKESMKSPIHGIITKILSGNKVFP